MKIKEVKIKLDKDHFYSGEKVTGHLHVRTHDSNWIKFGKIFLKFYDKLDIEWVEDERMSVGVAKIVYTNFKKPFQMNKDLFLETISDTQTFDNGDIEYSYPFEYTTPTKLQSTLHVKNARCNYFLKAYLTTDEAVSKHYQSGVNVFDEFFKSLTHTYCKQEVIMVNPPAPMPLTHSAHVYEAKSPHIRVTVVLPKLFYTRNESVKVECKIEHTNAANHRVELHKVSFKLFQLVKVVSDEPYEKSRLFDTLIAHSTRKHVHQNNADSILLEEYIQIPNDLPSSSNRLAKLPDGPKPELNPIRVNYKLGIELWKNFLINELDVNIPLMIDPEQ